MNYYPHHIGDFNNATRHLTRVERSIYRDLIDLYYDNEGPLSNDIQRISRLVIAVSDEERTAVQQVLNEFFTETEHGYAHARCDQEIEKYQAQKGAKSSAGKASAAKRALQASKTVNERSTAVQQVLPACSTNQEPEPEPEPEPITKEQQKPISAKAPDAVEGSATDLFARFWKLYPNKKGKAAAEKAWSKLKVTDDLFALIAGGLAKHCASREWLKDGGEFIPHPATWLNGKRWEDEVKPAGNVHAFPRKQANGPDFHSGDTSWANDLGDL